MKKIYQIGQFSIAILPDSLDLIETRAFKGVQRLWDGENTADWVDTNNNAFWALLLELSSETTNSASSTGSGDHQVDVAFHLAHDLIGCVVVVRDRIVRVRVLVENDCDSGVLGVQTLFDALCLADVRVWRVEGGARRRANYCRAKSFQDVILFFIQLLLSFFVVF